MGKLINLSFLLLFGCAGLVTERTLPLFEVEYPILPKIKKVTYRLAKLQIHRDDTATLHPMLEPLHIAEISKAAFPGAEIKILQFDSEFGEPKSDQPVKFWEEKLSKAQISGDIFIEVVDKNRNDEVSLGNLPLIHVMFFGWFPIRYKYRLNWSYRIYDDKKKLILESDVHDSASVWFYGPLVFFSKSWNLSDQELYAEMNDNAVKKILQDIQKINNELRW